MIWGCILILLGAVWISGCSKISDKSDIIGKSPEYDLFSMKSYAAVATISYCSNRGENIYTVKQYCKDTGEYKYEVVQPESYQGIETVFDGEMIHQKYTRVGGEIKNIRPTPYLSALSLFSFLENYMQSEQLNNRTKDIKAKLAANIIGSNPYLYREELTLDENQKPKELVIYDVKDKKRIIVQFSDFEYNSKLDDSIFTIDKAK